MENCDRRFKLRAQFQKYQIAYDVIHEFLTRLGQRYQQPDFKLTVYDGICKRFSNLKKFFKNFYYFLIFFHIWAKNTKNSKNFIFQRIWKIPKGAVRLSQSLQKIINKLFCETPFSGNFFCFKIEQNRVNLGPYRTPENWSWLKIPSDPLKARLNWGIHHKKMKF